MNIQPLEYYWTSLEVETFSRQWRKYLSPPKYYCEELGKILKPIRQEKYLNSVVIFSTFSNNAVFNLYAYIINKLDFRLIDYLENADIDLSKLLPYDVMYLRAMIGSANEPPAVIANAAYISAMINPARRRDSFMQSLYRLDKNISRRILTEGGYKIDRNTNLNNVSLFNISKFFTPDFDIRKFAASKN